MLAVAGPGAGGGGAGGGAMTFGATMSIRLTWMVSFDARFRLFPRPQARRGKERAVQEQGQRQPARAERIVRRGARHICLLLSDSIPIRSWLLFRAEVILRPMIESHRHHVAFRL
jgi:hypothetical protein